MSGATILVVDDHIENLKLMRVLLLAEGYAVNTAVNADEALARLRECRPDLILMDIQLPGMDGLALTRLIKLIPECGAIPVVAVTSYAMKGDQEKILAAGCDGYISKPIDTRAFPQRVKEFLKGGPLREEKHS